MDQSSTTLLVLALIICSYAPSTTCRDLNKSRKLIEEDNATCWDSLFELQRCTGEIALFMLNGETYLGPSCCSALRTIQTHCWPSMLSSVGINGQESDALMGYCDTDSGSAVPRPPRPSPPPSPPSMPRFTFTRHH